MRTYLKMIRICKRRFLALECAVQVDDGQAQVLGHPCGGWKYNFRAGVLLAHEHADNRNRLIRREPTR